MIELGPPLLTGGDVFANRLARAYPLGEAALDAVRQAIQPVRQVRSRDYVLRDGAKDNALRVILGGMACRCRFLPDGRRQLTAFLVPGDICCFSFLSDSPVAQSIIALNHCTVGLIDLDRLGAVTEAHPDVMTAILRCAAVEYAMTQELLLSLGGRNALHRVAHLLCEMHHRLSEAGLVRDGTFELPLTQSELGESLGLSTVHVNRTVQMLRKQELALWRDRTVTLPDPEALARSCGFDKSYLLAN